MYKLEWICKFHTQNLYTRHFSPFVSFSMMVSWIGSPFFLWIFIVNCVLNSIQILWSLGVSFFRYFKNRINRITKIIHDRCGRHFIVSDLSKRIDEVRKIHHFIISLNNFHKFVAKLSYEMLKEIDYLKEIGPAFELLFRTSRKTKMFWTELWLTRLVFELWDKQHSKVRGQTGSAIGERKHYHHVVAKFRI